MNKRDAVDLLKRLSESCTGWDASPEGRAFKARYDASVDCLAKQEEQPDFDLQEYLHQTIVEIYDLLDPRSVTPHQNAISAHAKAWKALQHAEKAGLASS
jgi:hypothetical protein